MVFTAWSILKMGMLMYMHSVFSSEKDLSPTNRGNTTDFDRDGTWISQAALGARFIESEPSLEYLSVQIFRTKGKSSYIFFPNYG
jgi:hypothetical protein